MRPEAVAGCRGVPPPPPFNAEPRPTVTEHSGAAEAPSIDTLLPARIRSCYLSRHDKPVEQLVSTSDMQRALHKARLMSGSVPGGDLIWNDIRTRSWRDELARTALLGRPPAGAYSGRAIELVGRETAQKAVFRQFVGLCVRVVLEEEGFEVSRPRVRLREDPLFVTGALYRRRTDAKETVDLLERFLDSLTADEAKRASAYLRKKLHTSV